MQIDDYLCEYCGIDGIVPLTKTDLMEEGIRIRCWKCKDIAVFRVPLHIPEEQRVRFLQILISRRLLLTRIKYGYSVTKDD